MTELKNQRNNANVIAFLESIENPKRKKDSYMVLGLMKKITKSDPAMWGPSMIGFGSYHYKYASGREGDWFLTGFSPRKQRLAVYIMSGFKKYDDILTRLGKYKTGKSCLYINKLEDIDMSALEELISASVTYLSNRKN
jgi:hypothetical protein